MSQYRDVQSAARVEKFRIWLARICGNLIMLIIGSGTRNVDILIVTQVLAVVVLLLTFVAITMTNGLNRRTAARREVLGEDMGQGQEARVVGNSRNWRPYRRLWAQQRALGLPCWICDHDIDPGLAPATPGPGRSTASPPTAAEAASSTPPTPAQRTAAATRPTVNRTDRRGQPTRSSRRW
ncbi:hypothetical protein [Streptomyces sp. NPDC046979]|uniref:hypothetical protein n=1 Tax=Streptomyces sp. NPDC046979 TaxID=3154604 RepID=UPI0033E3A858